MESPAVSIRGLTRSFSGKPPTVAVDDLSLDIYEGEFLVLLGPSGCGKTTTLRCLAGLESPDAGLISLGGTVVFDSEKGIDRPPEARNVGMVFQSYALWPHKTVRQNLEYPLRARRIKEGISEDWAAEVAELVECAHLLDRYPGQLSGGQQQRVALARGLVAKPALILFDEPLSNLDARLRRDVRSQLHALHRRLGFTAVYVTHDQDEAFALGDRVLIMDAGRPSQDALPRTVYEQPANDYVADFIGMSNKLALTFVDGAWFFGDTPVRGDASALSDRTAATLRTRPGDLGLARPAEATSGLDPSSLYVDAAFVDASYAGRHRDALVTVGDTPLLAHVHAGSGLNWVDDLKPGDSVVVTVNLRTARIFDEDGAPVPAVEPRDAMTASAL